MKKQNDETAEDMFFRELKNVPLDIYGKNPREKEGFNLLIEEQRRIKNPELKNRILSSHLGLVVSLAKHYVGKGMDLLDLINEGYIGLERSYEHFDTGRGVAFSTYASKSIKGALEKAVNKKARTIRLPEEVEELLSSLKKIYEGYVLKFSREPTTQEFIEFSRVPKDTFLRLAPYVEGIKSLDAPQDRSENSMNLYSVVSSRNPDNREELEAKLAIKQIFETAGLTQDEKDLIGHRWELEGYEILSDAEQGERLGINRGTIHNRRGKVMRKLKESAHYIKFQEE